MRLWTRAGYMSFSTLTSLFRYVSQWIEDGKSIHHTYNIRRDWMSFGVNAFCGGYDDPFDISVCTAKNRWTESMECVYIQCVVNISIERERERVLRSAFNFIFMILPQKWRIAKCAKWWCGEFVLGRGAHNHCIRFSTAATVYICIYIYHMRRWYLSMAYVNIHSECNTYLTGKTVTVYMMLWSLAILCTIMYVNFLKLISIS